MTNALCLVGLHSRVAAGPYRLLIHNSVQEYRCRRCGGRWEKNTIALPGVDHIGVMWERIA